MKIQVAAIGEGTLLLSCLKTLKENGFNLTAVFSDTTQVTQYCEDEEIPTFPRAAVINDTLGFDRPDYLFSISNPRVLKAAEIQLPKCLSINYHDSLLPAYSGLNATSWALMNGETAHGISWHIIETGIDTGDILKSEAVVITADDTAFTLNLKCQQTAKKTFELLLEDILNDELRSIPQDLSRRSYFGLDQLLPNLGVLSFELNCDAIYNVVRALEYGHHENRLGVPKVLTATGEFLLVKSAEPHKSQQSTVSPGLILNVKDEDVLVSTVTEPINLSLAALDGGHISAKKFKNLGLVIGQCLKHVSIPTDNQFVTIRKKEDFWRKKVKFYEPLTFFRQRMNVLSNIIDVSDSVNLHKTWICMLDERIELRQCQASFLAFLARIFCILDISIGILSDKSAIPDKCRSLYADICPCHFRLKLTSDTQEVIHKLKTNLMHHHIDKPFLKDFYYRYPEVNKAGRSPFHNLVIGQESSEVPLDIFKDCNMLILFPTQGTDLIAMYNKTHGQDYEHIIDNLRHFPTFLSSVSSGETRHLSDISLVSADEMKKLYTPSEITAHQTTSIMEEFEQQCVNHANAVALRSLKQSFTYQKCLKIVTKLSKLIAQRCKEKAYHLLAIHLPSCTSYVFSVLAALNCGLTFVPLPDDFPSERVSFILNDANIELMLTSEKLLQNEKLLSITTASTVLFKSHIGGERLVLLGLKADEDNTTVGTIPFQMPIIQECLGNEDVIKHATVEEKICYVMYTSGSTGKPKGVQVKEPSVINMIKAQIDKWNLLPSDTTALFASIGFDASISEMFTCLLSGGTLAILDKKQRLGSEFIKAVNAFGVTTITLPPSVLNIYSPIELPSLRKIITAGEACTLNIAMKWTKGTGIHFYNAYGPTETTVCATIFEFDLNNPLEEANHDLPIGHAIPGAYVYLFDDFMEPVPPGTVGQMYIGGRGVSGGYIGHAADRNQEGFVQNPLTKKTDILYRTGDHAFQDNDGILTFVGRLDDQVKVRGQRIDLSEIEQVLIQHIMVQVAVVVVHKCSRTGESALAAFIAPDFVFLSELREYLATVLPKYMIPTYIRKIKNGEYPVTLNGKIDRKTLSRDESVHDQHCQIGHSHLNEIQLTVAKLWCKVLKLDNVYAYNMYRMSSFLEMGGNSLHLVLLQRCLEENFKISLSFTDIGSADTIEEFADIIKKKKDCTSVNLLVPRQSHQLKTLIISDSELHADAEAQMLLGAEIAREASQPFIGKKMPMTILISGVTGFLGAFLLSELFECTLGNICCMVRETTEVKGFGKLVENMRKYNLWKFEYTNRIAIVLCDLTQEKLGIAPNIYNSLTTDVDAIFVNAALMNFNGSYEDHRLANVLSTQEFIKFAVMNKRKYLFMTSSLSVFLFPIPSDKDETSHSVIRESDLFEDPTNVEGGYGQSKWASERLVLQALDVLPGGGIFRPARISGTSTDGLGPCTDLFASLLIGMKKLGSYPDIDFPFDLTPVDFCAKAIIEIARKIRIGQGRGKRVFHIFNKETISFKDLFSGMNLRPLSLKEWREELLNASEDNKELLPLTPFFLSEFWDRARDWPVFDTTNTDSLVSNETRQLLKHSKDLLEIYKSFFKIV